MRLHETVIEFQMFLKKQLQYSSAATGIAMENVVQKEWEEIDKKLYKVLIFKDFQEAFAFMVRVAFLAEKNNHHPRWTNEWNKVEIWLSTHDAGDVVTEKDRNLAREINELLLLGAL